MAFLQLGKKTGDFRMWGECFWEFSTVFEGFVQVLAGSLLGWPFVLLLLGEANWTLAVEEKPPLIRNGFL